MSRKYQQDRRYRMYHAIHLFRMSRRLLEAHSSPKFQKFQECLMFHWCHSSQLNQMYPMSRTYLTFQMYHEIQQIQRFPMLKEGCLFQTSRR
jgi:hypothetical protein